VTKSRTVWAGHVTRIGEVKFILGFLRTPDGKRPPQRPRDIWWDNFKVNLQDGECERTDWIHLAQVRGQWRDVNTVMNSRVTKKIREISLVYEEESAYQQNLLSIELVMATSSKYFLDRTQ